MSFALASYQSTKVTTASPVAVVVSLYDGAIRFLRDAQRCGEANDIAGRGAALHRAHAIVSELQTTLDREKAPELCAQLDSLYEFVLHRITDTTLKSDVTLLAPAIGVLQSLASAWRQLAKEGA